VRELLALRDDEVVIVEMRLHLAEQVRARRLARGLSQRELAVLLGSSQPRVAHVERAGASLDLLIRALLVLGASRREIARALAG
jgi:transcriptional regulator with XRE-family HTH domain